MTKRDYYTVLGIDRNATSSEIKKAFRHRAMLLHPDKGGDVQAFVELKTAFEEAISNTPKSTVASSQASTQPAYRMQYDPFTDPDYDSYIFFEPLEDKLADFERHVYAGNCQYCGGIGRFNKLVHPEQGFFGREERFCMCQKVGVK